MRTVKYALAAWPYEPPRMQLVKSGATVSSTDEVAIGHSVTK